MRLSPFAALRLKQKQLRLDAVRTEVDRALAALREKGVVAEVIGSFVNGRFSLHSDVDFLIHDAAGLSDGTLFNLLTDHVRSAQVDMLFSDRLSAKSLAIMRAAGGEAAA